MRSCGYSYMLQILVDARVHFVSERDDKYVHHILKRQRKSED